MKNGAGYTLMRCCQSVGALSAGAYSQVSLGKCCMGSDISPLLLGTYLPFALNPISFAVRALRPSEGAKVPCGQPQGQE
jgi:hypothetical protein